MLAFLRDEPSYYRRRRLVEEKKPLRARRPQPNKLVKFKNAAVNWLNGLPPVDYDEALADFNADRPVPASSRSTAAPLPGDSHERTQRQSFGAKLARLGRFLNRAKRRPAVPAEPADYDALAALGDLYEKDGAEKAAAPAPGTKIRLQQLEEVAFIETKPSIREIILPPDYLGQQHLLKRMAQLSPKLRKRFLEAHPWTVSNQIRTAKYTVLTFLPKNLFEQFRRVANVYFLILIILQAIPIFSNTNPFLAAAPLVSILAITAIKDAIEDWKRQKSDIVVNHSVVMMLKRAQLELPENLIKSGTSKLKKWLLSALSIGSRLFRPRAKILAIPATPKEETGKNRWRQTYWKDVRVGDVLMLKNNESIPADIIILSTSNAQGICYVETKNLDGETNLKIRQAPAKTNWIQTAEQAAAFNSLIQVEPPSTRLYTFNGKMCLPLEHGRGSLGSADFVEMESDTIPVSQENLLLRGCQIRNTEFVIGVVAYTGVHTKIIMNSGCTPSKRSRIERQMNPQIILSFSMLLIMCLTCAIIQGHYVGGSIASAPYWYTVYNTGIFASPIFTGFLTFWSSLILFQTLVPISLYITVEAFFIHVDAKLYHQERNQRAVPRSWNIADDLGQIQYIFSDKTGTLTRNVMEFRKCSINGKVYGHMPAADQHADTYNFGKRPSPGNALTAEEFSKMEADMIERLQSMLPYKYIPPSSLPFVDVRLLDDLFKSDSDLDQSAKIYQLLFMAIVCHTILIDKLSMDETKVEEDTADHVSPHLLQYQAQSPDEAAIVKAAKDLGFVFMGRDLNYLDLMIMGQRERVEILNVIEFNSTRKRMSVIVKDNHGRICLFCKGADSVIYERLQSRDQDRIESSELESTTLEHLESFAEDGLRTLCYASRYLSPEEYKEFARKYGEASLAIDNRELLMDAVAEEYERELALIGATAIEDRLQDGVPDTIATLQQAGIKIWVLTGDKMETAINIGFSCRLLQKEMFLIMVRSDDQTVEGTKKQLDEGYRRILRSLDHWNAAEEDVWRQGNAYNTDDGGSRSVDYALIIDGVSLKHALDDRDCRPIFLDLATHCKAVLCCRVSPLQKAKVVELVKKTSHVMTLAIGDGANDVSMLQEADVGIGISGEEGMQAVMSSDYAISQFSYLKRLLLVHGHMSYVRTAKITLLCFFKNISFVLVAFWYQIYCAFTAQYAYDYMYLLYFNMIFTVLPVLLLGIFDRQVSDEKLLAVPQLYQDGIKQRYYSIKKFLLYSLAGIYQSLVCYFLPQWIYADTAIMKAGFPESKTMIGNVEGFASILAINAFLAMHMEHWNWIFALGLVLSVLVFFGFTVVYLLVPFSEMYGSWGDFVSLRFWATLCLTFTVALMPSVLIPFTRGWIWPKQPTDIEVVREIESVMRREAVQKERKNVLDADAGNDETADLEGAPLTLEEQLLASVKARDGQGDAGMWLRVMKDRWTLRGSRDVTVPERLLVSDARRGGRSRTSTAVSLSSLNEFAVEEPLMPAKSEPAAPLHRELPAPLVEAKASRPTSKRGSALRRITTSTFKFFNLRTGAMEDAHGYAFSDARGAAQLILSPPTATRSNLDGPTGEDDTKAPPSALIL